MHHHLFSLFLIGLSLSAPAIAVQPEEIDAPRTLASTPDMLKPWVNWVMKDDDTLRCPFMYNNQSDQFCAWDSPLTLDLTQKGGSFSFTTYSFAPDRINAEPKVRLPGGREAWPQNVTLNDAPAIVTEMDGAPYVRLKSGEARIKGSFAWDSMPDSLQLQKNFSIVHFTLDGETKDFPEIDSAWQLWLRDASIQQADQIKEEADKIRIERYRRIIDGVPTDIETRAIISISGKAREETIPHMLLAGSKPVSVSSVLPTRLETDGSLRILAQPGRWEVSVRAIRPEMLTSLALPEGEKQEIWAFESVPALRSVVVSGAETMNPTQTEMPEEWRNLPTYLVTSKHTLDFAQKKRGEEEPDADNIRASRILRLDADGEHYTIVDSLSGKLNRTWRLDAQPETRLGRVNLNGQDQFITTQDGKTEGVEVRPGNLHLRAESRMKADSTLPAIGWKHDVKTLNTTLYLPAGWSLFAANGVDNVSQSWIKQWSLLDIFLVLVTIVLTYHVLGRMSAAIMAGSLLLLQPELPFVTNAALGILLAMALLRAVPEGKLANSIRAARRFILLILLLVTLPFMVQHVRYALYPQLRGEQAIIPAENGSPMPPQEMLVSQSYNAAKKEEPKEKLQGVADFSAGNYAGTAASPAPVPESSPIIGLIDTARAVDKMKPQILQQYDPSQKVQTGLGIPDRQSQTVSLGWNGTMESTDHFRLWLISPAQNLVLALVRIVLLALVFMLLLGVPVSTIKFSKTLPKKIWQAFCLMFAVCIMLQVSPSLAEEGKFPPQPMLDELRNAIQKEMNTNPDYHCDANCVAIPQAKLILAPEMLSIYLQVHVDAKQVAIPIPGGLESWRPQAITIDGKPATQLRGDGHYLLLLVEKGVHHIMVTGPLKPGRNQLGINFPIAPHFIAQDGSGWNVQGIQQNGRNNGNVELVRIKTADATSQEKKEQTLESRSLPPFFRVERILQLGTTWNVQTIVERLTPTGESETLELPLLPSESQMNENIEVKQGKALLHFAANETVLALASTLKQEDKINLKAPEHVNWVESWRLNAGTSWHVDFSGIPASRNNNGSQERMWNPWPGEAVSVAVSKPKGISGQTMTIDQSTLSITAGERIMNASLYLNIQSSQGGSHTISLPKGAMLQQARINGMPETLQQKDNSVTLPIRPGIQPIELDWKQPTPISGYFRIPEVKLGLPSVNNEIAVTMPQDRWILWTNGPQMGPAILFWSWIPLIILLSYGLSRVPGVPLHFSAWLLLLLGLSQSDLVFIIIVAGWLLAMQWRANKPVLTQPSQFALRQVILGVWTLLALMALFNGIKHGLLGTPDMQITGNNSYGNVLRWYQDVAVDALPQPWIISVPHYVYRTLMLLWALWLSFALVRWLKWSWECFSKEGYWIKEEPATKQVDQPKAIEEPKI